MNLESTFKIFAGDTSLLSLVNNQQSCADKLNRDLERISALGLINGKATEVYFSRRSDSGYIPGLFFNNIQVASRNRKKHLGVILDKMLAFDHNLSENIGKANKIIGLITRLRKSLSRDTLLTIYKTFVRPPHMTIQGIFNSLRKVNPFQTKQPLQFQAVFVTHLAKNCIVNLD